MVERSPLAAVAQSGKHGQEGLHQGQAPSLMSQLCRNASEGDMRDTPPEQVRSVCGLKT